MKEYSSTALKILDIAQELIQERGYHAISFNDIALEVGIKKPSVIHHFGSKANLGVEVIKRYHDNFLNQITSIFSDKDKNGLAIFNTYCAPYVDFGESGNKICLCGALAGEFTALPNEVQTEVSHFFKEHNKLLVMILDRGLEDGSFLFSENVNDLGQHILNALQGSLITKRATGDESYLNTTIHLLKSKLGVSG